MTTMSTPCLMQGLTLFLNKNSDPDNQYGDKQGASAVDAPTRLQQRDAHTRQVTDDDVTMALMLSHLTHFVKNQRNNLCILLDVGVATLLSDLSLCFAT